MNTESKATPEIHAAVEELSKDMRDRILHTLDIFPFVSSSMLHISIGSANSTKLWRPVLDELLKSGEVEQRVIHGTTASERLQSYTVYMLAKNVPHWNAIRGITVAGDGEAQSEAGTDSK